MVAPSLVEQLQQDAIDQSVRVSDLLRKALLVASKLDIPNVPDWIRQELSGYQVGEKWEEELPPYRIVRGVVEARNPIQGWQPIMFETEAYQKAISERPAVDPMARIEAMAENRKGSIQAAYSADQEKIIRKSIGFNFPIRCQISRASMVGIIDEVRNKVLDWSMELDKAGIRGDGISFTGEEKEKAHGISIHVGRGSSVNIGAVGEIAEGANIAAGPGAHAGGIDSNGVRLLVTEIERHVSALPLADEDRRELSAALTELKPEKSDEPVRQSKARQLLGRVLGIVGKAGDTVITTGVRVYIENWMKSHGLVP